METTKKNVCITYDGLCLKIFMDSNETSMYGKEVFITNGMSGDVNILYQMIGNVGGYARNLDFDKDIDVIIFSDKIISDLRKNIKCSFIEHLEDFLNQKNTPYRKLRFISETNLLDYLNMRARSRLVQDKKDSNNKKISPDLKWMAVDSLEMDTNLLEMVKKYRASIKNSRDLFS